MKGDVMRSVSQVKAEEPQVHKTCSALDMTRDALGNLNVHARIPRIPPRMHTCTVVHTNTN